MIDLAIVDATVITMDGDGTVHDRASVLVDGGTITSIEPGPARPVADRVIDAHGGIVLPGLVNAHTHLAMTMFRGLADDVDLDGFLARLLPAEGDVLSEAAVAAGTTLAVAECLRAGITTALDMYFFPEASAAVAHSAGFDLRAGPVFVEFPGADRRRFDERLAWAGDLLSATPVGHRWVCPHGTYLLDEQQLSAVGALAAEHGARVHVHACETAAELAAVAARHGRSPIEVLRDTGLLGPGTVLAHGVHLTDDDLALVASSGAAVAHCPASNQKLGSGFARIPELLAAGVPVASRNGRRSLRQRPRPVAGDAPRVLLAGRPLRSRHDRRRDGPDDGHRRRRQGGRRHVPSARSRSGRGPTSSCSTRRRRRWHPCTTRCRRRRTQRAAATCGGSSPAARSSSTTAA